MLKFSGNWLRKNIKYIVQGRHTCIYGKKKSNQEHLENTGLIYVPILFFNFKSSYKGSDPIEEQKSGAYFSIWYE